VPMFLTTALTNRVVPVHVGVYVGALRSARITLCTPCMLEPVEVVSIGGETGMLHRHTVRREGRDALARAGVMFDGDDLIAMR